MARVGRPPEPWKRDLIIDAASSVFVERGVTSTGIQDLADAAGVSRAAIHYHFAGLEGVVLGVAERGFQLMFTERRDALAALDSPIAQLVTLMRMGIPDSPTTDYIVMYESIGVFRANEDFLPILESFSERQFELYAQVIASGVEQGLFRPREDVATVARNLLALEDANGIYITLGTADDPEVIRGRLVSYASSSLDCDLSKESRRQAREHARRVEAAPRAG